VASSNTLTGLSIKSLPAPAVQPGGAVTSSLIQAGSKVAQQLQTDIGTFWKTASAINGALITQKADLDNLLSSVQTLSDAGTGSFEIGKLNKLSVTIHYSDLQSADSLILGMVSALAAGSSSACMQAESANYFQETTILFSIQDQLNLWMGNDIYAPRGSISCATPAAFNAALKVVGGAAAVGLGVLTDPGAPAKAIPAAALLYVTAASAVGQIGVGGVLGQSSHANAALAQNGVQQFENLMTDKVEGTLIPATTGDLNSIAQDSRDLNVALLAATPPTPPKPLKTGTYSVTVTASGLDGQCCNQDGSECYPCTAGQPNSITYSYPISAGTSMSKLTSLFCPSIIKAEKQTLGCPNPTCCVTGYTGNSFTIRGTCNAPGCTPQGYATGCTPFTATENLVGTIGTPK
jgi:hypothetical protein